jgi:hypothetical protein
VPKSNHFITLHDAYKKLGDLDGKGTRYEGYHELPLRGPAGTCILYDTALFHTRFASDLDSPELSYTTSIQLSLCVCEGSMVMDSKGGALGISIMQEEAG